MPDPSCSITRAAVGKLAVGPEDLQSRDHIVRHRRRPRVSTLGEGGGEAPLGDDANQVLALEDRKGAIP
ncbi:MAG TPA: hypothetical protein VEY96_03005 [Actinomycetes bacterium]|nr:hypothetical protein [Actinomycetes bacterium]